MRLRRTTADIEKSDDSGATGDTSPYFTMRRSFSALIPAAAAAASSVTHCGSRRHPPAPAPPSEDRPRSSTYPSAGRSAGAEALCFSAAYAFCSASVGFSGITILTTA